MRNRGEVQKYRNHKGHVWMMLRWCIQTRADMSDKATAHNVHNKYYEITHMPTNIVLVKLNGEALAAGEQFPSQMLNQFQKDYQSHVYRPYVKAGEMFRLVFDVLTVPISCFMNASVVQTIGTLMMVDLKPFTTVYLVSTSVICSKDSTLHKLISDRDPHSTHRLVTDSTASAFAHLSAQLEKVTEGRDKSNAAAYWAAPVPGRPAVAELPRNPLVL